MPFSIAIKAGRLLFEALVPEKANIRHLKEHQPALSLSFFYRLASQTFKITVL
jgi:hypothetical protein